MIKYDIYDIFNKCYYKKDCTLITVIPTNYTLSDDEVRQYFDIDEDHRDWDRAHAPTTRCSRYVFDKCIIPAGIRFRLEACEEAITSQ